MKAILERANKGQDAQAVDGESALGVAETTSRDGNEDADDTDLAAPEEPVSEVPISPEALQKRIDRTLNGFDARSICALWPSNPV